ncbi:MAG: glycosyltransferase [Bacteroidota bacterium]
MVSVIIPVYNGEKYISETIQSVISQTYTDWELIVVNDGSTDNTLKIVEQYCQKDKRIKLIDKINEGVSVARNTGYLSSKGDFLAFLDADDKWHEKNLSKKIEFLKTNSEIGLIHADMQFIDESSNIKRECYSGKEGNILKSLLLWDGTNIPSPSSILVRREVIQIVGLFDTDLSTAADQEFFFRVASKYKIARIPRVLGFYRFHSTNMHKNIALMEKDHHLAFIKAKNNKLFHSFWFQRRCFSNLFLIIGASWWSSDKLKSIKWLIKAVLHYPFNIFIVFKKMGLKIKQYLLKDRLLDNVKYLTFVVLKLIGVLYIFRNNKHINEVTVLLFHRISDEKLLSWSPLTLGMFERILKYIMKHYDIVSLNDAIKNNLTKKPKLVLTFDDGYKDFYLNALPLLKKHKLPALVNIVTNTINANMPIWSQRINDLIEMYYNSEYQLIFEIQQNKFIFKINDTNISKISSQLFNLFLNLKEQERNNILSEMEQNCPKIIIRTDFLNRDEIIESSKFNITFGNHSSSHCNINDLITKDDYDQELLRSKEIIEEIIGEINDIFAFPNGIYSDESKKIMEDYGFTKILIVEEHTYLPKSDFSTHLIPRKTLYYKSLIENEFKIEGFHTYINKSIRKKNGRKSNSI